MAQTQTATNGDEPKAMLVIPVRQWEELVSTVKNLANGMTEQKDRAMTQKEAATFMGVSPVTIWRWLNSGVLPVTMIGSKRLIKKSDLEKLLKSND